MSAYSLVLDNDLLKEFHAFRFGKTFNKKTIARLLEFYKSHHLMDINQLKRTNLLGFYEEMDPALISQSLSSPEIPLEELAQSTTYKIILSTEQNCKFPKINIFDTKLECNFSSTCYRNMSRTMAHNHIKALCKMATKIFIYDAKLAKILNQNQQDKSKHAENQKCFKDEVKKFFELMPQKELTFYFRGNPKKENNLAHIAQKEVGNICKKWKFQVNSESYQTYHDLHDRYLLIDDKIEVILTSGFDNLFNEQKDFTYIVRHLTSSRFPSF
ncbi:hypothetical protein [Helicobacter cetorum]|uniref:hypothetical protein n=1 Tax=Helicobacter cetorum TaxID=138563 RepID=UPI000CF101A6|nr:hypothetical protein [Helicobacter cetorum]